MNESFLAFQHAQVAGSVSSWWQADASGLNCIFHRTGRESSDLSLYVVVGQCGIAFADEAIDETSNGEENPRDRRSMT
ncbi:uncharacterized protein N7469_005490 [Penicillium citrinum]|uniref:Uncharacterized protein n=2 Tax=Penicillium TaxID=5073 RepID=A0A9W9TQV7_PENCI|nr:uncharacterized protein N7469_005490 [Penicillium citrinum]KAJ5233724.1 hypothetical protein N7469_005490 [Penicillium citrinum]KAJ5572805.1 hypothetical protein N7450_009789 [Penicillium hetheringtonii]KAK5790281.1 hypothetical protein VI817_007568 [Penicillium citrinum]